jgi:nicotinamide mononucleotide adenylyltransferase
VLLTTGALNPVHRGHVAMFDKARVSLEAAFGLEVVGGFLSPSHDLYRLMLAETRTPHPED